MQIQTIEWVRQAEMFNYLAEEYGITAACQLRKSRWDYQKGNLSVTQRDSLIWLHVVSVKDHEMVKRWFEN